MVETNADKDLQAENVQAKREAAQRWANHVSADSRVKDRWRFLLVGETDLGMAKDDWDALVASLA